MSDADRMADAAKHARWFGSDDCWCGFRHTQGDGGGSASAEALKLIATDRQAEYGDARNTHERIAAVWNAIVPQGTKITPVQVSLMMTGLKLVRASKNPGRRDSFVDAIGYLEIGARMAEGDQ